MGGLIRAIVDASALRANLAAVRQLAPRSRVLAIVKANAYGHGLVPTAQALTDADAFGVARLEEGLALRAAGVRHEIVLLEGIFDAQQMAAAAEHSFDLVVHCAPQIALLTEWRTPAAFRVWLKVDTGMNRLGFRADEFAPAYRRLAACPAVKQLRVLTHLANADVNGDSTTAEQLQLFEAVTAGLNVERSVANSAGLLAWPATHADWVRPGLALYGVSPLPGRSAKDFSLRPAMTLASTVIATRRVLPGERAGYGGRWTARRVSTLAIAAAGYGDGYPRHMANGTPVLVNGARAPLAGRVSMDMIAIDVTDLPPVKVGDSAVLWGEGLPAEEVAPHAETIPYELLCGVSQRVEHEFG
ncbi:MAG: alanine racemase [Gammaproteobacteria bacterium]|nr:alanine racemase [Gammaproteobacteria bacterium]